MEDDNPDAVIIDMQVGSMGGMAIVRALLDAAAMSHVPRTPTILLLDRSADVFLAGRAGADAFLVKPIVAEELRAALRGYSRKPPKWNRSPPPRPRARVGRPPELKGRRCASSS